jgi:glycosyltransferase involved in cell wall biosynthesis
MTASDRLRTGDKNVLVILPTYNRAGLLPVAVESVFLQDYPHKKLVIVDDGSTDETSALCARYVKDYPGTVAYVFKANGGCASARNVGLQWIDDQTGYVCFLDSDDRLLPGKLSREVALLSSHPGADFTYSDSVIFEEETGREEMWKVAAGGAPERFSIEHFLTLEAKTASILYRAETVRSRRFREDLLYNEDSDFLQKIAIECRGIYCAEPGSWGVVGARRPARAHGRARPLDEPAVTHGICARHLAHLLSTLFSGSCPGGALISRGGTALGPRAVRASALGHQRSPWVSTRCTSAMCIA